MAGSVDGSIIDFTAVDTVKQFPLGTEKSATDGNTYVYIEADEALDQYAACRLLEDGGSDELTTTNSGAVPTQVVVPQVAIASGSFGWAVAKGLSFSVLALANCAADVKVYTTATAGAIDDTATDLIQGLRLNAANGGSTAAVNATAVSYMRTNAQD